MKKYLLPLILLFSVMVWAACQPKAEQTEQSVLPKEKNPNAISEMAALMRKIDKQAERLKQEIQDGNEVIKVADFSAIRTAETTKENIHSPGFSAFAETYLSKQEELVSSPLNKRKLVFNEMIDLCMNCHYSYCPGPTAKIKRYYLPKEEMPVQN